MRRQTDDAQCQANHILLRTAATPVLEQLRPRAREVLEAAISVVARGSGTAEALAVEFMIGTRSLLRRSTAAGLPPPRRYLAWLRIALAAALLERSRVTVVAAARAVGYASDHALRRVIAQFLDLNPESLRDAGSTEMVLDKLAAEIRRLTPAREKRFRSEESAEARRRPDD
jgi:transcriptional regulator GlxA family with amidase domain